VLIEEARRRISEQAHLHAFISVSSEDGEGTVVAVKDLVDVRGTVTTAGAIVLPDKPATEDAPVIARLRRQGAVIVGKTNLHEFAYGVTSVNPHFGAVLNPHDPSRVAGGSSGGSAVAVAAAMCDWAVGSDTGGSIRIPASLCGVVGFKPELGSIDTTGVFPLSPSLDTLGPIGPDVATVTRAFGQMSGDTVQLKDPLRKPRLAVPAGWVRDLDAETERAWKAVSAGVPEIEFVDHGVLFRNALTILMVEASAYHRRWATEHPEKYGADVLEHIRRGFEIPDATYRAAVESAAELRAAARAAMAEIDALILPATAIVAPPVSSGNEVREPLTRFSRPFNMTGQPVVALPAPATHMPVGIQVVGRTNAGALAAAAYLEASWR
jgi:aspartyl-tRNA(Asn)/glutamyl-tRNA(Gln) amidotransferase subunit A